MRICSVEGCLDSRYYAKGLCVIHYHKQHRKLNPEYYKKYDHSRLEYKRTLDRKRQGVRTASGYFKMMYHKHIEQRRLDDKKRYETLHRKQWLDLFKIKNAERRRELDRNRYVRHKAKRIALVMRRRAHKGKATPKWLTDEQKHEMFIIYKNRPQGFHVDHIIPLQGKEVVGLHVPWNLQYLLAEENIRKGNKI